MKHAEYENFFPGTHEGTHGALPTVGSRGVGTIELLTVLIECLTVLLEYIDLFIPVTGHTSGHTKLLKRQFI